MATYIAKVTFGITHVPAVLGSTLFTLYRSDLPNPFTSESTYMYTDDTTVYCVRSCMDEATGIYLNKAIEALVLWCRYNSLIPHAKNCETMIIERLVLRALVLGQRTIKWVSHLRLLGVTGDKKLIWTRQKKSRRDSRISLT